MNREFKGVWIPKEIWLNTELSMQEKMILVEIHSYDVCFASNAHFAEFLGLSLPRVKAIIGNLRKLGYISSTEERKGKHTVKRTLIVDKAKYHGIENDTDMVLNPIPPRIESNTRTNTTTNTKDKLISNGVSKPKSTKLDWSNCSALTDDDIKEIMAIRKKHTTTQRVVNSVTKEINTSLMFGYSIEQVLTLWAEKGWRTYKHDWMINAAKPIKATQSGNALTRVADQMQAALDSNQGLIDGNDQKRLFNEGE